MAPERPPADPADGILVERAAGGDRAAFEILYARHAPAVMAFAHHLLADRTAAEDATQETFVKVWRHARRFRAGAPFEPWLYRIARNEAFDAHAAMKASWPGRRRPASLESDAPHADAARRPPTAAGADDAELARRLADAVPQLSPPLREAFVLVRLMGRAQDEAASLLDVPVGTVKSRVAAAEAALRLRLGAA